MRYNYLKDVPDYAKPTIQKLIDSKALTGKGGTGDDTVIDLGEDAVRLLVILDRFGLFDIDSGEVEDMTAEIDVKGITDSVVSEFIQRLNNG